MTHWEVVRNLCGGYAYAALVRVRPLKILVAAFESDVLGSFALERSTREGEEEMF